ncbi:hypothetical protein BCR32DRAFT_282771 [Anaeromyces robustus]|uniref:Uncharacterized protein n=1 Tax=Anaeromyces robustus TaxID=1754192 RepID=A0A1Y1WWJ4_9FUNG|nr:hypothetical protein BCR32DRAFT_282771 [Anaeromyces robustus]|eukprot:ORX77900.1 hypothetical protein BCR32DRAFT_282771 [Anaeromyces robustus]
MNNLERNTELFYKELNNDCNPENLLKIAKDGIYLYEPLFNYEKIKNHVYAIEISILASQYFMINNIEQYNEFIKICQKETKDLTIEIVPFSSKEVRYIFKLIIPNKFLLEQLFNEQDEIVDMFLENFKFKVIFPFLYKYNFITAELFNLFYSKDQSNPCIFEIFEFLTDNNKVLLEKMANSVYPSYYLKMIYFQNCRDEKLLKCLSETFTNINLMKCESLFRVPLAIPYRISKKYVKKIFLPNKSYIKCDDKFSEEFINDVFNDDIIRWLIKYNKLNENYLKQFKRHNFVINKNFNYKLIDNPKYEKNINDNNSIQSKSNFCYCLVDEYIKLKEPEKCGHLNKYYTNLATCFGYDIENLYELNFVTNCLNNNDEISKILNDPDYIFNSKFDTNNATEYFLIRLTYIISLIHNKGNTFLIKLLLKNFFHAKFLNNRIRHYIFKYGRGDEGIEDEEYLIALLKNTPNKTFNSYIYSI